MKDQKKIKLARMDPEIVSDEIEKFIIQKILNHASNGGVIGLSGGVDSTLTAALAKGAFDRFNNGDGEKWAKGLELVGYILPSNVNNPADEKDAITVAEKLGIRYEILNIEPVVEAYRHTNPKTFESAYHKGNLMSEIRATILHQKAATEKKLVIGTGNRDEDFGVGYYTLFGDGAVHMSPIGNLPKRLVKELAIYRGFVDAAKREPTDGLAKGRTDATDLGYEYNVVEMVTEGLLQGFDKKDLYKNEGLLKIITPQLSLYNKFSTPKQAIDDVLNRHYNVALQKVKLVHPEAAQVTLYYN